MFRTSVITILDQPEINVPSYKYFLNVQFVVVYQKNYNPCHNKL